MSQLKLVGVLALLVSCAAPGETPNGQANEAVLASEFQDEGSEQMAESPPEPKKAAPEPEEPAYQKTVDGVTGLPGAKGQSFQKLDEYLAHLEKGGHIDRPFWERMKDGRYRWNTGRGMQFQEPKYASREELLAKYGFED